MLIDCSSMLVDCSEELIQLVDIFVVPVARCAISHANIMHKKTIQPRIKIKCWSDSG